MADGIMRTDGAMSPGSAVLSSASGSFSASDQGKYIQVIGAGPGGTSESDAAIAAGSAVLTSGSAPFASSDVGRGIVVAGAGADGSNLVASIKSYSSPSSVTLSVPAQTSVSGAFYNYGAMTLEATIQSVQSSSTVTLSSASSALVSSATYAYGTDNHIAFQTALDTAGQSGGGQVNVPAPSSCPAGAVCGYVVRASDQQTAKAPGAIKIRYSNVSLVGSAPQTNLFCRGAYGVYTNTVAYPNATGEIRGFCLNIGDNGGPNGAAGESVSNVTVSQLHLYGMTNGNTFNVNFGYPPTTPTGDGWDPTHKAIYMWDNSSFANITINSVIIQDFKAENIYSGGSTITGMTIENSTMTNFNGDGISMLAAQLQVLNNTISNGSNAAVENSTVSQGSQALVQQIYQGNTVSLMPREGIVVVGVDSGVAAGSVQILNNTFDTIAQTNPSGTESAIYIASQNNYVPPANVTVSGNTCHDCQSFGVFQTSGNTLIQNNNFIVDRYNAGSVFSFMNALNGVTISNNTGSTTAAAQAANLAPGAVYQINPGYASGGFPWKNVIISGNSWSFPGVPQYEFVTTSGLGWGLVTLDNLRWEGDVCNGCTHADVNHGLVNLATATSIRPYGPAVYVSGNPAPVTATVDASKEEDGSQILIVNAGTAAVLFSSDSNLSLPATYTLQPGGSVSFVYSAAAGKYTLPGATMLISTSSGTPQSATAGTAFASPLQALVTSSNAPVSGVTVTFTAPSSGASASFGGSVNVTAVTGANGIATAPTATANGQTGSYVVTASITGSSATANFSLTNTAAPVSTGVLTGSGTNSTSGVNLTSEGSADWEHWGDPGLTRKAGVTAQLSNYTSLGSGSVLTYSNDPRPVSWTDGAPLTASSSNYNGVYIAGIGQGFSLTAPADTTSRTLNVHVGGWYSGGTLTARLSDGSAAAFVDTTAAANGQYDRNYTLVYQAGSAGQMLTVSWAMTSGQPYGNVTLNAAALSGGTSAALTISSSAGTPQTATEGAAFAAALQATVLNSTGSPASGITVTFTSPTAGASATFAGATSATAVTNANGVATAPALIANTQAGSYPVTATAAGATNSTSFILTNTAPLTISVSATAGTPQSAAAGTAFATPLQATVINSAGAPASGVLVTFTVPASGASATFGGSPSATAVSNSSGIATAPTATANSQTGSYQVTATASGATAGAVFNLTNASAAPVVSQGGGVLTGSGNSLAGIVNLTAEGTSDWVHWGDSSLNRKAGVSSQLSSYLAAGNGSVLAYNNDPRPMSWTDGTPMTSAVSNTNGIYISGAGQGFVFTAPADTTSRTLTVHVGGWFSGGTFTAHLSDRSAADFTDVTATASGQYDRNYTLTYQAGSAGQTITITWQMSSGSGNVTLNAAALAGGPSVQTAPATSSAAGSLTGAGNSLTTIYNLTTEGVTDWIHWGDASLNRKASVTPLLSNYSVIGGGPVQTYSNDPRPIMWTDGTPTGTAGVDTNGVYINFIGNGFAFTAPADTTVRTLTVHVGGWFSGGALTAHLSDGSAADFVDNTSPVNAPYDRNYTLTYNAANSGQTLTVTWIDTAGTGNVTLNGAALK